MKLRDYESYHEKFNHLSLFATRQLDDRIAKKVQAKLHVTESFINRLGLEKELQGHTGCVNCLEWNAKGTILASASDDQRFILWDPFRYRRLHVFETGHYGNIFTVKFIPGCGDNTLVTGAGDCRVRIHDLEHQETIATCSCHSGRVKRIATAPDSPFMFWTAAEDGLIMEFDMRTPHTCHERSANILINFFPHMGLLCEAKCLSINPVRPELLAVGANDPYVRLYDRRMIRPSFVEFLPDTRPRTSWERIQFVSSRFPDNLSDGCVQYFIAGHLPSKCIDYRKQHRNLSCTYLTFSPSGTELLVNLGSEQIYLFDIYNQTPPKTYHSAFKGTNGYTNGKINYGKNSVIPYSGNYRFEKAEQLNTEANQLFEKEHFTSAIRIYNKAVNWCPTWATLYANRAAALMKRGWDGDVYAALKDCLVALQLDPNHLKSHFRLDDLPGWLPIFTKQYKQLFLTKCLLDLQCVEEACKCLNEFKSQFPEQASSRAFKALDMDIVSARSQLKEREKEKETGEVSDERAEKSSVEVSNGNSGGSSSSRELSEHLDDEWRFKWHQVKENVVNQLTLNVQFKKVISIREKKWRSNAYDYEARFCGHCNTTTDIKEVNFFGREGQYVVAGSDDGSFFVWERSTTNIVQVIRGDDSIVNCLQPHPDACLLATSGIDPVVRLWSPLPQDGKANDRAVLNLDDVASANQRRMNADPFEVMLMNMGYRVAVSSENENQGQGGDGGGGDHDGDASAGAWPRSVNCAPS